jgi:hypothetical protein
MTSEDMSWFDHQHPVRGEDGLFRLTWTFPRAGKYRLYADFTPADGDNQIRPLSLTVAGGPERRLPLTPDTARAKRVGDLRFQIQVRPGTGLRMEKPALLTYTVRDAHGRPVKDLQPYIGAMGHLLAISQDGKEVVHTHVLQGPTPPGMGGREPLLVSPSMISEKGPVLTFKLTLPSGGLWKTWAQFMRGGKVYTVPFTFFVQDLWSKAPATPRPGRALPITIVVDGGYQPDRVSARPGQWVVLAFLLKEKGGCGDVVEFPSLSLRRPLRAGRKTLVAFTPKAAGTIAFTCRMGMYRGQIVVR